LIPTQHTTALAAVERYQQLAARREGCRAADRVQQFAVAADVLLARRVGKVEDHAVERPGEVTGRRRVDASNRAEPVEAGCRVGAVLAVQVVPGV